MNTLSNHINEAFTDAAQEVTIDESLIEYISKDDKDAKIAVINKQQYVVLTQLNLEKQNVDFYVNKDQIDELCKILQKMK